MNVLQNRALSVAGNRKEQIAVLKELRAAGVEVRVRLNACARAIADEVKRLLDIAVEVVKVVAVSVERAVLAYWAIAPIKPLNARAVRGAIALSAKLFA